jgi:hypothetical protein
VELATMAQTTNPNRSGVWRDLQREARRQAGRRWAMSVTKEVGIFVALIAANAVVIWLLLRR